MSDKIKDALPDYFIDRMQAWAIGHVVSTSASSWPHDGPLVGIGSGSKFHTHRIPPLLGRVHDTEMAICTLPGRYQQAVRQFWIYEGQSMRWHGRHRAVNHETFEAWVLKGHDLLKSEFYGRDGQWKRLREDAMEAAGFKRVTA
jgi:hypothetical protein